MSETYPHLCREVGLSCKECIKAAAEQTARVCIGLRSKAVGQIFVQLYPHPACAPMHAQFDAVYQQAQRKGPARKTLEVISAVA